MPNGVIYEIFLKAKPQQEQQLKAFLEELVEKYRQEKGCLAAEVLKSNEGETTFQLIECWASEKDHAKHVSLPSFKKTLANVQPLLDQSIEVTSWKRIS